jgi:hypothetical protein
MIRQSVVQLERRPRYDLEELRRRLQVGIDDLVRQLYGTDVTLSGSEWRIASATGGKGTSCVIGRRGTKAGLWFDHNPGAQYLKGGVIDLIAAAKGLATAEAIQWAANWINLQPENERRDAGSPDDKLAGPENLARLENNLRRHKAALQYLFDRGLNEATISKFHLGIKEPYRRKTDGKTVIDALCYPLMSSNGEPLSRYGCYNIPDVTQNPVDQNGWGRGSPDTYYSNSIAGKSILFVTEGCKDLWVLDQHITGDPLASRMVLISSSHGSGIPAEWRTPAFWASWEIVYFGHDNDQAGEQMARNVVRFCGREALRARVPEERGKDWTDFFKAGGTVEQFCHLLASAAAVSDPAPERAMTPDAVGEFAANPVNINGAFVNGYLYYPFTVERREVEKSESKNGTIIERMVTSYVTKVLRSDGSVLDIVMLPAPRGTPHERRVLALTDGTRIEREPQPSYYATWQLESLQSFIRSMQDKKSRSLHRSLREILTDVVLHFRRSVWIPYDEDYTVLALYVALSYVYHIFDAIPLVIVSGEKGSGKSELGDAICRVSFNATIIGQGSAASVVRLLNEARGLVVLDDLEAVGRSLEDMSFNDINQMLKLSYKKRTGRKALTDKNGKTTIFDFYGPKVINNTQGVDSILGSRMLYIQTRRMPEPIRQSGEISGSDHDELINLRNELHVWGMANAREVHDRYRRLVDSKKDRDAEISAPLLALAELSEDEILQQSLVLALDRQPARRIDSEDPVELLKEAVYNCIRQGATRQMSGTQLNLELRLIADPHQSQNWTTQIPVWQQAEWIGHQLRNMEIREIHTKVSRVRLYGIITRIYDLRSGYVREVLDDLSVAGISTPETRGPLEFCERMASCAACPYNQVCEATIPGLQRAKALNKGKSGRKAFEIL